MATVTVYTAAHMKAIEDATVTSMSVNGAGHLIVTRHDGSTFDAGDVSVWLPGRLKAANVIGSGADADTFQDSGWYAGTLWAGPLSGFSAGVLEVLTYQQNVYVVQNFWTVTPVGGVGIPRRLNRLFIAGAWTAWVEKDSPATTTLAGEVELATSAESITGTDAVRAVTPAGLAAVFIAQGKSTLATVDPAWNGIGNVPIIFADLTTSTAKIPVSSSDLIVAGATVKVRSINGVWYVDDVYAEAVTLPRASRLQNMNANLFWYDGTQFQAADTNFMYSQPFVYRMPGGWISLEGVFYIKAAIAAGQVLFTLPREYRPLQSHLLICNLAGTSYAMLNVDPNGDVTLFAGAFSAAQSISISGLGFNNNPALTRTPLVLSGAWQKYSTTDYTPQYVVDDGYGRLFIEGMVKNATAVGNTANPIATTAANPGLTDGTYGTLHHVASVSSGFERINIGYPSFLGMLTRESAASIPTGLSLNTYMPNLNKYNSWSSAGWGGSGNGDYGAPWRPVKHGPYGDGVYGLTGLGHITTAGAYMNVPIGMTGKLRHIFLAEASQAPGRSDIDPNNGQISYQLGNGSYWGLEENSWVPRNVLSSLRE